MSGTLGPVFVLGALRLGAGRAPAIRLEAGAGGPAPDLPPARIGTADWTLTDADADGALRVELLAAPDPRGAPIDGYDAQVDDGAWAALHGLASAAVEIADLSAGVPATVRLRARNAIGPGLGSAPKTATPTDADGAPWHLAGGAGALDVLAAPDPAAPIARGGETNLQITG